MCIAILKPQGKTISKETLQICFDNNPDGCGFAYPIENDVVIKKFMKFEDFYPEYEKYQHLTTLIHFRIATHGAVEIDNCHPFVLNSRMALIHNGIITGYGDKKTKSDTRDFIDRVIGNISWKMWKNPSFCELVGNAIGYSKLAILDKTGAYVIINEHKGEWTDGIWYSNTSYKYKKYSLPLFQDKKEKKEEEKKIKNEEDDWEKYWHKMQTIYKCGACGKEFYEKSSEFIEECMSCHSSNLYEVGYVSNGKETRYTNPIEVTPKICYYS